MRDDEASKVKLIADSSKLAAKLCDAPPAFVRTLFKRAAAEDILVYSPQDLASLIATSWRNLKKRTAGKPVISVFNTGAEGSPLAAVTVIEILNDNMPFLLDSLMAEITEAGHEIRFVVHPILRVGRSESGVLKRLAGSDDETPDIRQESLIHLHIERLDEAGLTRLSDELATTLRDVRLVVTDWKPMMGRVQRVVEELKRVPPPLPVGELSEAIHFLEWLIGNNFTFLGLREYVVDGRGARSKLAPMNNSGLGLLRDPAVGLLRRGREPVTMTPELRDFLSQPRSLIITKANLRSRVHRRTHLDYVGVKLFDPKGNLTGELRICGLFTSTAYTGAAHAIPYLRRKVEQVISQSGFDPQSHSGKALVNIIEQFPRDELFQIDEETLSIFAQRILQLDERPRVRVLLRADKFDRFQSVLVYLPRERYTTTTRLEIGKMLAERLSGRVSSWTADYPEGPLARLHFIIGRRDVPFTTSDTASLETAISAILKTWRDSLADDLMAQYPPAKARALRARYQDAFGAAYSDIHTPAEAVDDIRILERLHEGRELAISFYKPEGAPAHELGLKLFHRGGAIALSTRVPLLEAMGFKSIEEYSVDIMPQGDTKDPVTLHDVRLSRGNDMASDFTPYYDKLEALFMAVWQGRAESDGFNELVVTAGLSWREIALVRAIARYLRQARLLYSQDYMWATLVKHAVVAADLVALFATRFGPLPGASQNARTARQEAISERILERLAQVDSLDEDRILRRFLNVVQSMLRTNYYQLDDNGLPKATIAFKLDSQKLDQLPAPRPMVEISVYSPRVEGVHLRFGKIARGGIRWSDRPQDFRTEVLALVKAQQVKNAVIVPVGAKGGFVPKHLPPASDRQAWLAEGTGAYQDFIAALLDLTDNIDVSGKTVVRPNIVRWDGDDPYLVVAADKGTATFSDTANAISARYNHWLGDAFASGGSVGYDHKKMGITARGAWEAVKRHFREGDVDIQSTPFTVAGVGDMSGDVFGNGMLLSTKIRLVAAFDHRDIFLDPSPDPAKSHAERQRLFNLPRSSWADYDKRLISAGGGIFPRSAKSISLSPEIRALLDITKAEATPQEVMTAILRARVDLLWFGGIGTYIRAAGESNEEAGDRANDAIRILATDLRCKAIGEGANLGMTQRARVEAAGQGIRLNTDAIDNSAGVNTSDVEVNIKIALGAVVRAGKLTEKTRNTLLASMTDEVGALVLRNNYLQSLALSLAERRGAEDLGFARRLMRNLEQEGRLDRAVEYLPQDWVIDERARQGKGLTRPELAVLLAYAKLSLFDRLLDSPVPDDAYLGKELARYFPVDLTQRYASFIEGHRLRREIIATMLSNSIINRGGPTLVPRIVDQTGASAADIAAAFAAVRDSFKFTALNTDIDRLDTIIPGQLQLSLYADIQSVMIDRIVWFLRNAALDRGLTIVIDRFGKAIDAGAGFLAKILPEADADRLSARKAELVGYHVPPVLAARLAALPYLALMPDVVLVADATRKDLDAAARTFFAVSAHFRLGEIAARAGTLATPDYYSRLALDRALSDLSTAARRIAAAALKAGGMANWTKRAGPAVERTRNAVSDIAGGGDLSVAKLAVAAGLLGDLAGN